LTARKETAEETLSAPDALRGVFDPEVRASFASWHRIVFEDDHVEF
jgi:hypothetical protein